MKFLPNFSDSPDVAGLLCISLQFFSHHPIGMDYWQIHRRSLLRCGANTGWIAERLLWETWKKSLKLNQITTPEKIEEYIPKMRLGNIYLRTRYIHIYIYYRKGSSCVVAWRFYHHPKGTRIFKDGGNDFQGCRFVPYTFSETSRHSWCF